MRGKGFEPLWDGVGGIVPALRRASRGGYAAPNEHKEVGVALIDLDDATAEIFDNLIVTLCYHSEAMIPKISRLRRVGIGWRKLGIGWRKLPCLHMQCMSTLCIRKVAHVMCGPRGPWSIPKGALLPRRVVLVFRVHKRHKRLLLVFQRRQEEEEEESV